MLTSPAHPTIAPPAIPPGLPDAVAASVVVPDARAMDAAALARATAAAYHALRERLRGAGGAHVVRVWNYVPALLAPAAGGEAGTNRYMAFNAGRYAAMCDWFGADRLADFAPAATGVGAPGDDLIVHGLATPRPGVTIQNPRQTPAVFYSSRYGPRPPCFARAMRVGGVLLVSGTAAIRGEDTVSPDDLHRQLDLTFDHLRTLAGDLAAYRALRVYVPRVADTAGVVARVAEAFPQLGRVEPVVTDLCRAELRVEIEGVADDHSPL